MPLMAFSEPPLFDPLNLLADPNLRVDGANEMLRPFGVAPGSQELPALFCTEDSYETRTGPYFPLPGWFAVTVYAQMIWAVQHQVGMGIRLGTTWGWLTHANTADRTYTLPDKTGTLALEGEAALWVTGTNAEAFTIYAGQPVKVVAAGTFGLARANLVANLAVGIATRNVAAGGTGRIAVTGVVAVADWSNATGGPTTLTAGADYYLAPGTNGIITTAAPTGSPDVVQILGRALSTTELVLNPTEGIIL